MKIEPKVWMALGVVVLAIAVYANSLDGEFVYDDTRQLTMNPLIQDPNLYGKALTSDVWAFKGGGGLTASNYWRPVFTAWCIANYRLFGVDPFGWHVGSIILHSVVCLLAFLLLLRLGMRAVFALAVAAIFAVHPIHSESVAWISGTPDLLFSVFLLGSLLIFLGDRKKPPGAMRFAAALALYLLAVGSKEIGVLCFPIYGIAMSLGWKKTTRQDVIKQALVPFGLAAIAFFIARQMVLGTVGVPATGGATVGVAIASAPLIFVFYLGQGLLPVWLSPNYPLRAITSFSLVGVAVPVLVTGVCGFVTWWLTKRSRSVLFGAALLTLPLAGAFYIPGFIPDQIVHDRYLYLPVLGLFIVFLTGLRELLKTLAPQHVERLFIGIAAAVVLLFSIATIFQNRIWATDLTLWQHAAKIDTQGAFTFGQLGVALSDAGRSGEAIVAFDRSIAIGGLATSRLGKAFDLLKLKRFPEAVAEADKIISLPNDAVEGYTLYRAYEVAVVALREQNKLADAETLMRSARDRMWIYRAALTEKLAVVLYLQDRKAEAVRELESARAAARTETLSGSKSVFYRLGQLYGEMGNSAGAKQALTEYLDATSRSLDPAVLAERRRADEALRKLN